MKFKLNGQKLKELQIKYDELQSENKALKNALTEIGNRIYQQYESTARVFPRSILDQVSTIYNEHMRKRDSILFREIQKSINDVKISVGIKPPTVEELQKVDEAV